MRCSLEREKEKERERGVGMGLGVGFSGWLVGGGMLWPTPRTRDMKRWRDPRGMLLLLVLALLLLLLR